MSCIQNLSGLLNTNEFSSEENLIEQNENSKPGDFYLYLMRKYKQDKNYKCPDFLLNYFEDDLKLRKVTKRAIMTFTYGSTKSGFNERIVDALIKKEKKEKL